MDGHLACCCHELLMLTTAEHVQWNSIQSRQGIPLLVMDDVPRQDIRFLINPYSTMQNSSR